MKMHCQSSAIPTYKADFGVRSPKLIIEAKFATSKEDFKTTEKEIQEDCITYLPLVVSIYGDSASYATCITGDFWNSGRRYCQPPVAIAPKTVGCTIQKERN
jgi:hypothetical protein